MRLGVYAPIRLVLRDVAQSGSAPEWGSGGRGFKSRRPDFASRAERGGKSVLRAFANAGRFARVFWSNPRRSQKNFGDGRGSFVASNGEEWLSL